MKINGYKCFYSSLINRYGKKFYIGEIYVSPGILKFGINGNGFHLCKNIEDTFRFFDTKNKDICVCEVIGSGNIVEYNDEYNGYYDMYCVEKMELVKELSREEIINIGLDLPEYRVKRFLSTLSLSPEEVQFFKEKYKNDINILNIIQYYQEGNVDVYNMKTQKAK